MAATAIGLGVAAIGTAMSASSSSKARKANKKAAQVQGRIDRIQQEAERKELLRRQGLAESNLAASEDLRSLEIAQFAQERAGARFGLAQAEQELRLQAIQSVRENAIAQANIAVAGEAAGIGGSSIVQGAQAAADQARAQTINLVGQAARFQRNVFDRQEAIAGFQNQGRQIQFELGQESTRAQIASIENQLQTNQQIAPLTAQLRQLGVTASNAQSRASDAAGLGSLGFSFASTFGDTNIFGGS